MERPKNFNELVELDTKELTDSDGVRYQALVIVDAATKFTNLILLDSASSWQVAAAFLQRWAAGAGELGSVVVDQGAEFRGEF